MSVLTGTGLTVTDLLSDISRKNGANGRICSPCCTGFTYCGDVQMRFTVSLPAAPDHKVILFSFSEKPQLSRTVKRDVLLVTLTGCWWLLITNLSPIEQLTDEQFQQRDIWPVWTCTA
jgi:hypothetical protein